MVYCIVKDPPLHFLIPLSKTRRRICPITVCPRTPTMNGIQPVTCAIKCLLPPHRRLCLRCQGFPAPFPWQPGFSLPAAAFPAAVGPRSAAAATVPVFTAAAAPITAPPADSTLPAAILAVMPSWISRRRLFHRKSICGINKVLEALPEVATGRFRAHFNNIIIAALRLLPSSSPSRRWSSSITLR